MLRFLQGVNNTMSDDDGNDNDSVNEEILDNNWSTGPMAEARSNLNIFCSNMLMQKSLRLIIDEMLVLEDILKDDDVSIVDKVSARQTLTILNSTWMTLTDELGYDC